MMISTSGRVRSRLFSTLLLLTSILCLRPVFAQQRTADERAEQRLKIWNAQLKLTDQQQLKIRDLLTQRERDWDDAHARIQSAAPADRPQLRSDLQQQMQSYRDKLHGVLTPDQQKRATNLREMQRGQDANGRGMGRGPGNPNCTPRGPGQGPGPRAK